MTIYRRPLTQDEKILYQKSVTRHTENERRLQIRLREVEHILDEGLYLNYMEQRDKFTKTKRELISGIVTSRSEINIASDFLKNGVPKKSKKV